MGIFNQVSVKKPSRTAFNLSYANKLSTGFGDLTPMLLEKVVPTDKFKISDEFMVRFAPLFGQLFQAIKLRTEYFFVPSRLLWDNFEVFYSQGVNGLNQSVHPYVNLDLIQDWFDANSVSTVGSILDYFNLPTDLNKNLLRPTLIDALPFYAYCKAFLDYYADENLNYLPLVQFLEQDGQLAINGDNTYRVAWLLAACHIMGSSFDFSSFQVGYNANNAWPSLAISPDLCFAPFKRSYPKDYFTSALPFAQRGPIVQIPLDGTGDVTVTTGSSVNRYNNVAMTVSNTPNPDGTYDVVMYNDGSKSGTINSVPLHSPNLTNENIAFKAVNINGTATITDLRTAAVVQQWLEKKARTGGRFKETLLGIFGASSKDSRLQRTQFLNGFSSTVKVGEVFTTAQDDSGSFVPGLGVSVGQLADGNKGFKRYFDEPGYCIGLVSFYPTASYYQGIPRQFLELDVMDYYWPDFQGIGEQAIQNQELFCAANGRDLTFGYAPRYSHYKSRTSQIHADFRGSLDYMTLARKFSSLPTLSNSFVQVLPSVNDLYRCFNATGQWANSKPVYVDIYHHFKAIRPMQYFGNPRLL